jgi:hypothetical protein
MLFRRRKQTGPQLTREESLSAKPVLSRLVKVERSEQGQTVLQVPRRDSAMVRAVARWFKVPPYRPVELDELGSFVIELCDGRHSVKDVVDKLAERYKLNRREAEVSTSEFVRTLARRSILALVIEGEDPASD